MGLGAQFARDIPFYAFFFGTYELTLRLLRSHTQTPPEASYLVAGAYVGAGVRVGVMLCGVCFLCGVALGVPPRLRPFGVLGQPFSPIHQPTPTSPTTSITGGMAGVAGWMAVMPIDMAKSIIQTSPNPKGLIPTMMDVVRARGPLALYSGAWR